MIVTGRGAAFALAMLALGLGAANSAEAVEPINSVVAEADLSAGLEKELEIESAGKPVELASKRLRIVLSDPRNRNQLFAILNDVSFEAPDTDDDGNSQSDFAVETILTLKDGGEEVSDVAQCDWSSPDKLRAQCSVYEGGGGFAVRVVDRGTSLMNIKWQLVIGEGLSVGYRAGSTERGDGKRLDYIIRIKGREPVVVPIEVR